MSEPEFAHTLAVGPGKTPIRRIADKPTAYLHSMTDEIGETRNKLSFFAEPESVWGAPGIDYSEEFIVEVRPLYG